MGKEIWMWKHFGTCEIEDPTNRGAFSCFLNRVVDLLFSKKQSTACWCQFKAVSTHETLVTITT